LTEGVHIADADVTQRVDSRKVSKQALINELA